MIQDIKNYIIFLLKFDCYYTKHVAKNIMGCFSMHFVNINKHILAGYFMLFLSLISFVVKIIVENKYKATKHVITRHATHT